MSHVNERPFGNDPDSQPTTIDEHGIEVDERVSRLKCQLDRDRCGAILAGIMAALALILLGVVAYILATQHDQLGDLQARQTASDTQRALTDATQRSATCTVITGLQGTYTEAERDAWPRGPNDYDHLFLLLRTASSTLRCGAS